MKKFLLGLPLLLATTFVFADTPVYLDDTKPIEERVEDALKRMTLKEKINIIHAQSKFSAPGVPRLGIPEIWCTDGPMGVRPEVLWDEWEQAKWTNDSCTAFPSLTALAATSTFNSCGLLPASLSIAAIWHGVPLNSTGRPAARSFFASFRAVIYSLKAYLLPRSDFRSSTVSTRRCTICQSPSNPAP